MKFFSEYGDTPLSQTFSVQEKKRVMNGIPDEFFKKHRGIFGNISSETKESLLNLFETLGTSRVYDIDEFVDAWGGKGLATCILANMYGSDYLDAIVNFGMLFNNLYPKDSNDVDGLEIRNAIQSLYDWFGDISLTIEKIPNEDLRKKLLEKMRLIVKETLYRDTDNQPSTLHYIQQNRATIIEKVTAMSPDLLAELSLLKTLDSDELENLSRLELKAYISGDTEHGSAENLSDCSDSLKKLVTENWKDRDINMVERHCTTIDNDISSESSQSVYYVLADSFQNNNIIAFNRFQKTANGFKKGTMFNIDNKFQNLNLAQTFLDATLASEAEKNPVVITGKLTQPMAINYIEKCNGVATAISEFSGADVFEILIDKEFLKTLVSKDFTNEYVVNKFERHEKESKTSNITIKKYTSMTDITIEKDYVLTRIVAKLNDTGEKIYYVVYEKINSEDKELPSKVHAALFTMDQPL